MTVYLVWLHTDDGECSDSDLLAVCTTAEKGKEICQEKERKLSPESPPLEWFKQEKGVENSPLWRSSKRYRWPFYAIIPIQMDVPYTDA